ncbi:MAG TPA: GMC oxidoreductase [Candidatus Limnocylindrales bacterium]|nr:GMC oxidoreductase [Candidatus Limnocylindrales bacterium]
MIVIVGSGPAGVSAAWPLLDAGLDVHMIDPGVDRAGPSALDARSFTERREDDDEQWRVFLGGDAAILANASPKLRAPEFAHVFAGFRERYRIAPDGFAAHGSLAPGGLSNAWGSGVGAFSDAELAEYPVKRADLAESYRAIAERIGISGSPDDDLAGWFGGGYPLQAPNPLEPPVTALLARHERRRRTGRADRRFRLGRPQQAVLTADLGERRACNRSAMCIYGCHRRAIYSAADELAALRARPGFTYSPGWFVTRVERDEGAYAVHAVATRGSATRTFAAERVLLAAGTLGSTKLALELIGAYELARPLLTTPVLTFALVQPEALFGRPPDYGFALGYLAYALELARLPGAPEIFGGLLPTAGMPPSELYGRLPLLRPFARSFGAWLWPRLLVSACFFPGRFSASSLRLRRDGALAIEGGYTGELRPAIGEAVRALRREFRVLGATLLPGTTKLTRPGEEMHYGGTLPMRAEPRHGETDADGRLAGLDGVHVVDGAVLTSLPAKSHTMTIMANADRIARRIAVRAR